jgi:hypothetical protein
MICEIFEFLSVLRVVMEAHGTSRKPQLYTWKRRRKSRGSSDAQCHWRFSVLPHYVLYHNDFYNDREAARVNGATKKKWRIDGSALFSCINL